MYLVALLVSSCCAASFLQPATVETPLRIGSFNIKTFGKSKMNKLVVAERIAKIVSGYDVLLIQEIKDKAGLSIIKLFDMVTKLNPEFGYVMSDRLGRGVYKEQYAFFFRTDRVYVKSEFQYDDGPDDGTDVFSREPFCIQFWQTMTALMLSVFAVCGIHIEPGKVPEEMDGLLDVYNVVAARWGTRNVVLTGDFNADGSYLTRTEEEKLLLKNDPRFLWVIGSEADTTTKIKSNNAYDRILVAGTELQNAIVPGSGKVDRFDLEESPILTESEAYAVSDHYPVEVSFKFV
ncbi:hypothetical protein LOTGIDRAFT_105537 [Lottia gigantea]|uniref:Deoxyribonuclease n=1 Tax=Lottia gigantea TaxID=225164 RepID=V4A392_LOTGI|nr:hypothetical protein LOTGIDRAFT_105537 [Lottia gigantea]ESO91187.1 hypothetical protein LOTGIDRAFT_105537 [Lottia gigantea]